MKINSFLAMAVDKKASDVHLISGVSPAIRINQELICMEMPPFKDEDLLLLARQILSKDKLKVFEEKGEVDVSYESQNIGCFRVNVYRQRGVIGIAARVINDVIPTAETLQLPEIVNKLARYMKGLVLVTGPTGSGKSTTLAAMTDQINRERACHIVTLEDPIEYNHPNKKSIITQREIGRDSSSFPDALRASLRQDPDVILVGEMRDLETIAIAMTAAETGHLVLATLHTNDAAQTIERIVDVFPFSQQQQVRVQLASTLLGVLSQRLIRRKDGSGMIAAVESLFATPAVRTLVREGKGHQIHSYIETGSRYGMQTMDKNIQMLYEKSLIAAKDAYDYASDQAEMKKYLESQSGALKFG